jgi:carbon storage regulator
MLVLSRQRDETIMIGDEIEITVVDIRGDKVRLGINAPSRIAVHRKEVYDAIREENERAAALRGELAPTDIDVLKTVAPGPAKGSGRDRTRLIATPSPALAGKAQHSRGANPGQGGNVARSA